MNPHGPPKQYHFQPGTSGNPGGKPAHYLTHSKVKTIIDKYLSLTKTQLEKLIADKDNTPALELMIASTILSCIKAGDFSRLEGLLSRAVGRTNVIQPESDEKEEVSKLSMNDLLTLVKSVPKEAVK